MRTIEDIRSNLDYVGCDNETVLALCDEVERLRAWVKRTANDAHLSAFGGYHGRRVAREAEKLLRTWEKARTP